MHAVCRVACSERICIGLQRPAQRSRPGPPAKAQCIHTACSYQRCHRGHYLTISAYGRRANQWDRRSGSTKHVEQEPLTYEAAIAQAARLLAFGDRSAFELQQRLAKDGYQPEVAQRAVEHLQAVGLVDDERYAELYARGQWLRTLRAPARIQQELQAKGVPSTFISAALQKVFGQRKAIRPNDYTHLVDEDVDKQTYASGQGGELQRRQSCSGDEEDEDEDAVLEEEAWALILQQAQKRADLTRGELPDKRKAKLARWLQSRGHSWDTVSRVIRILEL